MNSTATRSLAGSAGHRRQYVDIEETLALAAACNVKLCHTREVAKKSGWLWWVGGLVTPAVVGVASNAFGLVHVGMGWMLLGLAVLGVVGLFTGLAAETWATPTRSRNSAVGALVSLLLFVAGLGAYNLWFDPSKEKAHEFDYLMVGDTCVPPAAEPGGEPLVRNPEAVIVAPTRCPGDPVAVECRVTWEGANWLKLYGDKYWLPEGLLRPRNGQATGEVPDC